MRSTRDSESKKKKASSGDGAGPASGCCVLQGAVQALLFVRRHRGRASACLEASSMCVLGEGNRESQWVPCQWVVPEPATGLANSESESESESALIEAKIDQ